MHIAAISFSSPVPLPLLGRAVRAGFPSPSDDFIEEEIDLQRLLVTNRAATFLVRVAGDSMVGKGPARRRPRHRRPLADAAGRRRGGGRRRRRALVQGLGPAWRPRDTLLRQLTLSRLQARLRGPRRGLGRLLRQRQPAPPRRAGVSKGDRPTSLALIDGNSFYCSCECVFDPRLKAVPVIVLSSNDGCAIARTAEAKAFGIRMGDPWFKIRDSCRRGGVRVFSSNYALYGDMSARANSIYRAFSPRVEIYSIDESFLDVSDVAPDRRQALARDSAPRCCPEPVCRPASGSARPRRWPS